MDNNMVVGIVFMALEEAFDSISHSVPFQKLKKNRLQE